VFNELPLPNYEYTAQRIGFGQENRNSQGTSRVGKQKKRHDKENKKKKNGDTFAEVILTIRCLRSSGAM